MKRKQLSLIICSLFLAVTTLAQQEPSPEAKALHAKMMSQINKRHVAWIKKTAKETHDNKLGTDEVNSKAKAYGALNKLGNADIEALAFLVMMEASRSANEDLKAIMENVKNINEQKQKLRAAKLRLEDAKPVTRLQLDSIRLVVKEASASKTKLQARKPVQKAPVDKTKTTDKTRVPVTTGTQVSKEEADRLREEVKKDLDSMSEMGEMESLRLQMAMDRMSKMMSTLSNLMKKVSETANQITQNLK